MPTKKQRIAARGPVIGRFKELLELAKKRGDKRLIAQCEEKLRHLREEGGKPPV